MFFINAGRDNPRKSSVPIAHAFLQNLTLANLLETVRTALWMSAVAGSCAILEAILEFILHSFLQHPTNNQSTVNSFWCPSWYTILVSSHHMEVFRPSDITFLWAIQEDILPLHPSLMECGSNAITYKRT